MADDEPPAVRYRPRKFRDSCQEGSYALIWYPQSQAVVDTPHFQRLRKLYQLGTTVYVYPTAEHTRFPHSLGVGHRAREVLNTLQQRQPELGITHEDRMLVEVAGLCHDLGHGPYSHTFENELIPIIAPEIAKTWKHEKMSVKLLRHMVEQSGNDVVDGPNQYTPAAPIDLSAQQLNLIEDMIMNDKVQPGQWKGAWEEKRFMLDVVSNRNHGIDVDKIDYLIRDSFMCDIRTTTDFSPLLQNMRATKVYTARSEMHETVYNHQACKGPELMICQAFELAASEFGLREMLEDPEAYLGLHDHLVDRIEHSTSQTPSMVAARRLIARVRRRHLYKCVGDTYPIPNDLLPPNGWVNVKPEDITAHQDGKEGVLLRPEDVRVANIRIDWSKDRVNPLTKVGFYDEDDPDKKVYLTNWPFAPEFFQTVRVRVYLTTWEDDVNKQLRYQRALKTAFKRWYSQRFGPTGARKLNAYLSPDRPERMSAKRPRQTPVKEGMTDGLQPRAIPFRA